MPKTLINLLDLAVVPGFRELVVVDFTVELCEALGYARYHRVACTREDTPCLICGI